MKQPNFTLSSENDGNAMLGVDWSVGNEAFKAVSLGCDGTMGARQSVRNKVWEQYLSVNLTKASHSALYWQREKRF